MKPVNTFYFNNIPHLHFLSNTILSTKLSFQILSTFLSLTYSSLLISLLCLSPKCYVERCFVRDALRCTDLSSFLLFLHSWVWVFFLAPSFPNTPVNVQLPTSWSRALPQKLTGAQLVKKFPIFYVTPNVRYHIDTSPRLVPILSQIYPVHTLHPAYWRSILILSSHLRLMYTFNDEF